MNVTEHKDIVIDTRDGVELKLNITVPAGSEHPALVVYIHGGGWRNGSYENCRIPWIPEFGYALASISYRLTDKAVFPAQIHDCKGAVRWLRAHAAEFGYSKEKFIAAGGSAGGHLALLLGTSAGIPELEGDVAGHTDMSSAVSGVINYFGPTDFKRRVQQQPEANSPERGCYALFNGEKLGTMDMEQAYLGSPVTHLSPATPPIITLHGNADTVVPVDQATWLDTACRKAGVESELHIVPGAGHGDQCMFEGNYRITVAKFIERITSAG